MASSPVPQRAVSHSQHSFRGAQEEREARVSKLMRLSLPAVCSGGGTC
jgi:hypothetical protein